jgi:hypothetical protein
MASKSPVKVSGYKGTAEVRLAAEGGEVTGACGGIFVDFEFVP